MELIIGGFSQGKLDYAKQHFCNAEVFDEKSFNLFIENISQDRTNVSEKIILDHFHLCVRQLLQDGKSKEEIESFIKLIIENKKRIVLICDEIGNGIIPLEKFDREYREITGRFLIRLASESESVVRILCGIPQKIK